MGQNIVIKLKCLDVKQHTLEHKFSVYKALKGGTGIPQIHWFGIEDGFNAMTIDYLGPSLNELFACCNSKFTARTVLCLAGQLVSHHNLYLLHRLIVSTFIQIHCLQFIHSCNFIHHNLKPSNLVMGIEAQSKVVYLIDFGLSKQFRNPKTYQHILYTKYDGLTGNTRYASINGHLG